MKVAREPFPAEEVGRRAAHLPPCTLAFEAGDCLLACQAVVWSVRHHPTSLRTGAPGALRRMAPTAAVGAEEPAWWEGRASCLHY